MPSRLQSLLSTLYSLLFILVPLVWLPNTSELFEFNKLILTYILTILIVGTWAIRCILEKKFIFKRTLLDWPILIFLISQSLSLLFSIDPRVSWLGYYSRWNGGLLSLLSYSLLYWAFVSNLDRKAAVLSAKCLVLGAIPIAIWGSLEHFGASISCLLTTGQFNVSCWVQDVQTRVFATLGQPNWLAAYLVALIFLPPSLKRTNLKGVSLFILFLAALLFTKSRSGLLAFGISSLVFWLPQLKKNFKLFLTLNSLILILLLAIKNPVRDLLGTSTAPEKPIGPALEVGGTESGSIRKIVWTGATRIWTSSIKNLLIGTGPETFAQSYYQYRPIEHNQTSEWELLYNKAHNEFLNYLATTGLLGLTSYLILLGTMLKILISKSETLNKSKFENSKIKNYLGFSASNLEFALLAGWLTISVTNFWGFSVVIMQIFLFLFPAIAITLHDQ